MNAHNEQHDSASPVVKQNLTTQPAAAQEAVAEVVDIIGRSGVEIHWLAGPVKIGDLLYAAPVTAAPAGMTRDDAEQVIDRIMGDYGFSMPSRAYAELVDEFMCTPAAPGIDRAAMIRSNLRSIRSMADSLPKSFALVSSNIGHEIDHAMALLDASPKGDDVAGTLRLLLDERNHRTDGDLKTLAARCLHLSRGDRDLIAMRGALIEKLQQRIAKDSPQGGSEAWREGWALAYSGPSRLYGDDGELQDNSEYPYIDWRRDSAEVIRDKITERANRKLAKTQAGDAEVQP